MISRILLIMAGCVGLWWWVRSSHIDRQRQRIRRQEEALERTTLIQCDNCGIHVPAIEIDSIATQQVCAVCRAKNNEV